MSRGRKKKRNNTNGGRSKQSNFAKIFHSPVNSELRDKIDIYTKEFDSFCVGKTYYQIIEEYCKFSKDKPRKIRRLYSDSELNQLFTINTNKDESFSEEQGYV